jgi:hypothetical protein
MRFTASTQLERVIDGIAQNRNSVDERKTKANSKGSTSLTKLVGNATM